MTIAEQVAEKIEASKIVVAPGVEFVMMGATKVARVNAGFARAKRVADYGTDERMSRRYEMRAPWSADEAPVLIHLTDDFLFPLQRRTDGFGGEHIYGCRHSDVLLYVEVAR